MIKFKEFKELKELKEQHEAEAIKDMKDKIAVLMYLTENTEAVEAINESYNLENLTKEQEAIIVEGVKEWLNKVGLQLNRGDGIIDYLLQFGKGAGKLIMAGIKRDKKAVKEIASGFTKEKVMDFLLKLDKATLSIITGPLDFIDAITGWELKSGIEHLAKNAKDKLKVFYTAIKDVKKSITDVLSGDRQKEMLKVANNLEANMPDVNPT